MNYEKEYKALFEEHEAMKSENEEILNEYEATIKLLTETAQRYKEDKEAIEAKYNSLFHSKKAMKDDLEGFKLKNKDKMKDIEALNKQMQKIQLDVSKAIEAKKQYEKRVVALETDNDHLLTKLREHMALIDDMTRKLESALEEKISIQIDFDYFKQTIEEQLQRKDAELTEMRNELLSKEKALNNARGNSTCKGNDKDKSLLHKKRESFKNKSEVNRLKEESSIKPGVKNSATFYNIITPSFNGKDISEKVAELYARSFIKRRDEGRKAHNNSYDFNSIWNKKPEEKEKAKQDKLEVMSFNYEVKGDKGLECRERKSKIREGVENIKSILSKIQERKQIILNEKIVIKTKLDKFGIKL